MAISYTRLIPGTVFDAASLNSRFTNVRASLNDLTKDDVIYGALGRDHLPSLVTVNSTISIFGPGSPPVHTYTRTDSAYPGWGAAATAWSVINTLGGSGGGTELKVTFASTDPTAAKYGGLLVLANIQVRTIRDFSSPPATQEEFYGIVALQVQAGVTWYHLNRTERYLQGDTLTGVGSPTSNEQDIFFDIPIRTLIKASDVSNNSITRVRAVAAIARTTGAVSVDHKLRLNRCTLSVIGLQGSLS